MSAVSRLDSLAGLQRLKWVNADWTGVDRLPAKLPLGVLRVQSTRLSDEQVAKFASANPRCLIMHRWGDSLKNMISDATRLTIHSNRYVICGDGNAIKPLFETDDSGDIRAVIDGIRIEESQSGFHCMCDGTPFLKFYRGEELLAIVGFHHGRSLRWAQGWPGDGMLARQSGSFLVDWLANHGARGPANEIMRAKEQRLTADRKTTRAVAGLPKEVAEAFSQRSDEFAVVLTAGNLSLNSTTDHLMRVLRGKKIGYDELPDVPEDETIDVREGFDHVAGKRSEKEVAALALGFLHCGPAAEVISRQTEASPMYEVALALLGNYDQLKPYHFRLREDNTALQFAALKVVIDTRGAHGLKWATEYQQSQYWWEKEVVAAKLSQMLVAENAPGADMLVDCRSLDDVVKWYQQHGAAYVQDIEKQQVPAEK